MLDTIDMNYKFAIRRYYTLACENRLKFKQYVPFVRLYVEFTHDVMQISDKQKLKHADLFTMLEYTKEQFTLIIDGL